MHASPIELLAIGLKRSRLWKALCEAISNAAVKLFVDCDIANTYLYAEYEPHSCLHDHIPQIPELFCLTGWGKPAAGNNSRCGR